MPAWRLQQPSTLTYASGAMTMSDLCLTAGDPLLCLAASQDKGGNLDASYRLRDLPIALLMTAVASADLPLRADGSLQGEGKIRRTAAGALSGNASITSAKGTVTYSDHPERPLVQYDNLSLNAQLTPADQQLRLRADLVDGGNLRGQVDIRGEQQALAGQLSMQVNNLAFLELVTSELAAVKGTANGNFDIGGTLSEPAITGQAALDGFAAEVPSVGLKLTDGRIVLATSDAKVFRIDGKVSSGKGALAINGTAGVGTDVPTSITLKGSQFTAADIPSARVIISPDLTIKQSKHPSFAAGRRACTAASAQRRASAITSVTSTDANRRNATGAAGLTFFQRQLNHFRDCTMDYRNCASASSTAFAFSTLPSRSTSSLACSRCSYETDSLLADPLLWPARHRRLGRRLLRAAFFFMASRTLMTWLDETLIPCSRR